MKKVLIEALRLGIVFSAVVALVCICITIAMPSLQKGILLALAVGLTAIEAFQRALRRPARGTTEEPQALKSRPWNGIDPPTPDDLQIMDATKVASRKKLEGRPN